jgi:hypothetical protein
MNKKEKETTRGCPITKYRTSDLRGIGNPERTNGDGQQRMIAKSFWVGKKE